MFWGFVWSLTNTRVSTCTKVNKTIWFRLSLMIISILIVLLPLNSQQAHDQTLLEITFMIHILLGHLYVELTLWVS